MWLLSCFRSDQTLCNKSFSHEGGFYGEYVLEISLGFEVAETLVAFPEASEPAWPWPYREVHGDLSSRVRRHNLVELTRSVDKFAVASWIYL